jgi:hypothetical protein
VKGIKLAFILSVFIASAYGQNYDESKVPAYTLPNPLKTLDNTTVTDKTKWETVRRPEIVTLFADNIYGQMPKTYDSIKFSVKNENTLAMGGRAHLKEVLIEVFKIGKSVKINLVLFTPNKIKCPAPAFLLINIHNKNVIDPTRTIKSDVWPAEVVIDSGYAIAAFNVSDVAPDSLATYKNGVLQLYPDQLTKNNGMKAIGAWAWGASRVMDYFEKESAIDAKKVAVVGHSRGGKTALWAAAQDQRFAIAFSNCSGNTGAALARRRFGQTIANINTVFPYWFNNNYKKFNDNEDSLPVDQHMLITAIAPRPVYVTSASKDLWADPKGSFLSLKNAEKVYSLYGLTSRLPTDPPPVNTPVINSPLGYHNREGEHALTLYDWVNFIRFANYHHLKDINATCSNTTQVTSFTLVNATTDQDIQTIHNGDVINLATMTSRSLNIRANGSPGTGSIVFNLTGQQTKTQTEGTLPFSLFGDINGDYSNWTPAVGSYTLKATPYSLSGGTGVAGTSLTINFSVSDRNTDISSITSYTLINATTDQAIQTLSNGAVLNLATLPSRSLNIRANTSTNAGSVIFSLSGQEVKNLTESTPPFALFGDIGGNYNNWTPAKGNYFLKATPYSGSGGTGTAGTSLAINFSVTDQAAITAQRVSMVTEEASLTKTKAYPNPGNHGRYTVALYNKLEGEVFFTLWSSSGNKLSSGKLSLKKPGTVLTFDFSSEMVKPGLYYLNLESKNEKASVKLMLSK